MNPNPSDMMKALRSEVARILGAIASVRLANSNPTEFAKPDAEAMARLRWRGSRASGAVAPDDALCWLDGHADPRWQATVDALKKWQKSPDIENTGGVMEAMRSLRMVPMPTASSTARPVAAEASPAGKKRGRPSKDRTALLGWITARTFHIVGQNKPKRRDICMQISADLKRSRPSDAPLAGYSTIENALKQCELRPVREGNGWDCRVIPPGKSGK